MVVERVGEYVFDAEEIYVADVPSLPEHTQSTLKYYQKKKTENFQSSTYLGLFVILRVEIQIVQHHRVGCGQIDAQTTRLRGQQKHCVERRGVKKV